jgi:hypothetical protein
LHRNTSNAVFSVQLCNETTTIAVFGGTTILSRDAAADYSAAPHQLHKNEAGAIDIKRSHACSFDIDRAGARLWQTAQLPRVPKVARVLCAWQANRQGNRSRWSAALCPWPFFQFHTAAATAEMARHRSELSSVTMRIHF